MTENIIPYAPPKIKPARPFRGLVLTVLKKLKKFKNMCNILLFCFVYFNVTLFKTCFVEFKWSVVT